MSKNNDNDAVAPMQIAGEELLEEEDHHVNADNAAKAVSLSTQGMPFFICDLRLRIAPRRLPCVEHAFLELLY